MWGWVRKFDRRLSEENAAAAGQSAPFAPDQAGYALVDALVALLILSLTLVFGLHAAGESRAAIDQATEIRRARTLIAEVLEMGPRTFQDTSGQTDAFSWTLETRVTGAAQPVAVCHRAVRLTSLATHRVFAAATLETCPTQSPPA